MRIFTGVFAFSTIIVGFAAFHSNGQTAQLLKLAYAYLALTTVACALVMLAARKQAPKAATNNEQSSR